MIISYPDHPKDEGYPVNPYMASQSATADRVNNNGSFYSLQNTKKAEHCTMAGSDNKKYIDYLSFTTTSTRSKRILQARTPRIAELAEEGDFCSVLYYLLTFI